MIATIVNVEPHISKNQREYLVITVLDDYETKRQIFITPYAMIHFSALLKATKVPYIHSKKRGDFVNTNKFIGKIISVVEERIKFRGRDWNQLVFDYGRYTK